jgi:hypothetical protein
VVLGRQLIHGGAIVDPAPSSMSLKSSISTRDAQREIDDGDRQAQQQGVDGEDIGPGDHG